jgi:hypothetical protein
VILLTPSQFAASGGLLSADILEKSSIVGPPEVRCRRLNIGGERFSIIFPDKLAVGTQLDAHIVLDDLARDRVEAVQLFWSALRRHNATADPRLTRQRKRRLRDILRAVDARDQQASYRTIAEVLFPQHRIDAASWAGNALRETTIRLVRDGLKLVDGGYRALLRRSRKR